MKKTQFILLLLCAPMLSFCQEKEIVKILNRELKKEVRYQQRAGDNYTGTPFEIVRLFGLKDSTITMPVIKVDPVTFETTGEQLVQTTAKILSLEVKRKNDDDSSFYTERWEVSLSDITAIVKDINVIFETAPEAVTITRTEADGSVSKLKTDMFFLQLCSGKDNEVLADDLVKAFEKGGYTMEKGIWAD